MALSFFLGAAAMAPAAAAAIAWRMRFIVFTVPQLLRAERAARARAMASPLLPAVAARLGAQRPFGCLAGCQRSCSLLAATGRSR